MTTFDKVKNIVTEEKNVLAANYNVAGVSVFGSVARGEETDESDIDMLVDFHEPIGLFKLVALESYLTKKLGQKVEIATRKSLSPYIKDSILKEEQIIYA